MILIIELKKCERELLDLNHDYLKMLARSKGTNINCAECDEPLTDDEIQEAIDGNIKEPICEDCYQDLLRQKIEDARHPDDRGRHGA